MSNQWSAAVPTGRYASKAEARLAAILELLKAAGEIAEWEYIGDGDGYPLWAGEHQTRVATYRPDFWVRPVVGPGFWVVEVKGRVQREWPLKRRLWEACYPDVPLHVVPSDEVENYSPTPWRNGRRRRR